MLDSWNIAKQPKTFVFIRFLKAALNIESEKQKISMQYISQASLMSQPGIWIPPYNLLPIFSPAKTIPQNLRICGTLHHYTGLLNALPWYATFIGLYPSFPKRKINICPLHKNQEDNFKGDVYRIKKPSGHDKSLLDSCNEVRVRRAGGRSKYKLA